MLKKKTPPVDLTRTARSKAHLLRLDESGGKRLLVDITAEGVEALGILLNSGYGSTQKDVVVQALIDAASHLKSKS